MENKDISSAIKLIRQEIQNLQDEQNATLKSAAYLGMTPAIAKQLDEHRLQITELAQKLKDLERVVRPSAPPNIPDVAASDASPEAPKPS